MKVQTFEDFSETKTGSGEVIRHYFPQGDDLGLLALEKDGHEIDVCMYQLRDFLESQGFRLEPMKMGVQ